MWLGFTPKAFSSLARGSTAPRGRDIHGKVFTLKGLNISSGAFHSFRVEFISRILNPGCYPGLSY